MYFMTRFDFTNSHNEMLGSQNDNRPARAERVEARMPQEEHLRTNSIKAMMSRNVATDLVDMIPTHAIRLHTWGADQEGVTLSQLQLESSRAKAGHYYRSVLDTSCIML